MKILCVGGGSGGHITPIVAVVERLRTGHSVDIRVWCDRKFSSQARGLLGDSMHVDVIVSGKWRRYANLSIWTKLRHHVFKTYVRNFIDIFKITFGIVQSFFKLLAWRPDVIFLKGGFVCLPVGFAARLLKIPTVIHDSDTTPGLTNKILAKSATAIGTGSPVENYPDYPKSKVRFVGVPIRDSIHKFSDTEQENAKKKLGFDVAKKMVFVTGGGQGARSLNKAVSEIAPEIIKNNAQILLMAGRGRAGEVDSSTKKNSSDFKVVEFLADDYAAAIAASDVVVTRAGATTMAELAAASKPTIIVPNAHLSGDHQTKNAKVYETAGAAIVLKQDEISERPDILLNSIEKLIGDTKMREKLSVNLSKFAKPNALDEITQMIVNVAKKGKAQ